MATDTSPLRFRPPIGITGVYTSREGDIPKVTAVQHVKRIWRRLLVTRHIRVGVPR